MQGFTELTELQLNVSIERESYFTRGISVNWPRRLVCVLLNGGTKRRLVPMENVVWLNEATPEAITCPVCHEHFESSQGLGMHKAMVHDGKRRRG